MPLKKLLLLVWQNIARSKKNFVFSSIGIIVGITAFTFFIALSDGIRERVVNRIYPIDQLEVEPVGGGSARWRRPDRRYECLHQCIGWKPKATRRKSH